MKISIGFQLLACTICGSRSQRVHTADDLPWAGVLFENHLICVYCKEETQQQQQQHTTQSEETAEVTAHKQNKGNVNMKGICTKFIYNSTTIHWCVYAWTRWVKWELILFSNDHCRRHWFSAELIVELRTERKKVNCKEEKSWRKRSRTKD